MTEITVQIDDEILQVVKDDGWVCGLMLTRNSEGKYEIEWE